MQLQDQITDAENARDINTAQGTDLDNIGRSYGITRKPAVAAGSSSGANQLLVTNTTGNTMTFPSGTAVWNPSDVTTRFYTTASLSLAGNTSGSIGIQALQSGSYSNAAVGTLTAHNADPGFLISNFLPVQGGSSSESDEEFRYRITQTLQAAVIGGSSGIQAIKNLLVQQTGVADAIVQSAISGPGILDIIVVPIAGYNMDDDMLTTLEQLVYNNAAAGVSVNLSGPDILYVDAEILITMGGGNVLPTAPLNSLLQQVVSSYLNSLSVYTLPTVGQSTAPQNPNNYYLNYLTLTEIVIDAATSYLGSQLSNLNILLSTSTGNKCIQGDVYPQVGQMIQSRNIRVKTTSTTS